MPSGHQDMKNLKARGIGPHHQPWFAFLVFAVFNFGHVWFPFPEAVVVASSCCVFFGVVFFQKEGI